MVAITFLADRSALNLTGPADRLVSVKSSRERLTRRTSCSSRNAFGTHRAESFLRPRVSCSIPNAEWREIPAILAILLMVILRSPSTRFQTGATVPSLIAVAGLPALRSSSMASLPSLKRLIHS
ncbi:hypothetical protein M513_08744 [Trichuris suis]|uniref:Uncharacterized protein n=1 Tax=Trichuris suis TaxID=68888 RepID=A0A085LZG6_9BILA|nr:hypothetical protein M513_08744 [Trichuris suis]